MLNNIIGETNDNKTVKNHAVHFKRKLNDDRDDNNTNIESILRVTFMMRCSLTYLWT
jgi:hypothetical protein